MSLSEKYEYITNNGKYLGVREYYNYFVNLYVVEDVFFELWYFRDENTIEKIERLQNMKVLDLYINHMRAIDQEKS